MKQIHGVSTVRLDLEIKLCVYTCETRSGFEEKIGWREEGEVQRERESFGGGAASDSEGAKIVLGY